MELRAQLVRRGAIAWQVGPQVTPIAAMERRCRTLHVVEFVEVHASAAGQDAEAAYRSDEEAFQGQRGHTPHAFERWKRRLNFYEETFDPAMWLIVWDADVVTQRLTNAHHLYRRLGFGVTGAYSNDEKIVSLASRDDFLALCSASAAAVWQQAG